MRQQVKALVEEWVLMAKASYGEPFDIFRNPTAKEWRELGPAYPGVYRGIYDPQRKDLYMFPGYVLHRKAYDALVKKEKGLKFTPHEFALGIKGKRIMIFRGHKKAILKMLKRYIPDIDKWEVVED